MRHCTLWIILVCVWSQSFRHDWCSDMLCKSGTTAGLWFPDLVRLMLQKLREVRLHSTARQHTAQLTPWCTHPTQYCCDIDGTCGLSYCRGTSSIAASQNAPIGCCLLSSVLFELFISLTPDQGSKFVPHSASVCSPLSRMWGKNKRGIEEKTKKREKMLLMSLNHERLGLG